MSNISKFQNIKKIVWKIQIYTIYFWFTFLAPQPRFTLIAEGSCKTLVLLVYIIQFQYTSCIYLFLEATHEVRYRR